jgi:uncharacterized protein (TIGR03067 family)
MRKTTTAVLALCALVAVAGWASDPEPPDGGKAELKKLKGTWTATKILDGGVEEEAPAGRLTFTFEGSTLKRRLVGGTNAGGLRSYRVKIDTKKKPHTIELAPEGGGAAQPGIYKVEKGELYLALGRPARFGKGAVAPKDFSGDDYVALVMTREKTKGKGKE